MALTVTSWSYRRSMIDWGSVPDWCAAIFTGLGFGAAVYQLRRARLDQDDARKAAQVHETERREAMARAVGVSISWGDSAEGVTAAKVEVVNSGPFPIHGVVLIIEADEYPMEVVIGTLLPGRSVEDTYLVDRSEPAFAELTSGAQVRFTDTYGKHWSRTPDDLQREDSPARIC